MIAVEAASGHDALKQLRRAAKAGKLFDLAVIDMNLLDWEGFALAERIKSEPDLTQTKIILTTAYGQRGDAAAAQKIGVSGYLTKPIRGAQIFEYMISLLTEKRKEGTANTKISGNLITRHSLREAK